MKIRYVFCVLVIGLFFNINVNADTEVLNCKNVKMVNAVDVPTNLYNDTFDYKVYKDGDIYYAQFQYGLYSNKVKLIAGSLPTTVCANEYPNVFKYCPGDLGSYKGFVLSAGTCYSDYYIKGNSNNTDKEEVQGNVYEESDDVFNLCTSSAIQTFKVAGIFIYILRILIPLCLIIVSSISMAKVVMSGDAKDLTSVLQQFGKRLIAACIIFFIPVIISFFSNLIQDIRGVESSFEKCGICLDKPFSDKCEVLVNNSKK